MADKKISQLVDGGVPQATDEFVVDRAGADNFKLDWASLKTAAETDAVLDGDAAGGDLSGTYPDPDLAAIGVATGPVGDGTNVSVVTIDTKGRVTGLTSTPITGAAPTGAAGGALSGTYPNPDLAAAVAGAGLALGLNILSVNVDGTTIEINADTLRLKDTGPGATGPIGSATTVPVVTINAKGQVTALGSATITGVTPGGAAGGVLSGTYPNPGFAVDMATQAELDAAIATAVLKSLYDANTILAATTDDTPAALTVGASTFVGRKAAGNISAMSATEAAALLTDLVPKSLYDANTVLAADSDNTPAALTMGASTILARLAAGNIKAASVAEIVALLQAYTVGGTDVAVTDGGTGSSTAGGALTNLGVSAFIQTLADDADAAAARTTLGVGPPLYKTRSGLYVTTPGSGVSGINPGTGYIVCTPFYSPESWTATRIGIKIATASAAGGLVRLGIYNDDGTMKPGTLLVDAGTIDATSNTYQELTISTPLTAGIYWLAALQLVAAGVYETTNQTLITLPATSAALAAALVTGYADNGGNTGALPSPFAGVTFYQGATAAPRILLKR